MNLYVSLTFYFLCSFLLCGQTTIDTIYYQIELQKLKENKDSTPDEILLSYQKLREKAIAEGYPKGALKVVLDLAHFHSLSSNYKKGRQLADSVIQIAKAMKFNKIQADALSIMGWSSWRMDQLYAATNELRQAERMYSRIDDKKGLRNIYYTLAGIYYDLEDFEESSKYDLKSAQLSKALDNAHYYLWDYHSYANNLARRGKCEVALPILDEITESLSQLDKPDALSLLINIQLSRFKCDLSKKSALKDIYEKLTYAEHHKKLLPNGAQDLTVLYTALAEYHLATKNPEKVWAYIKMLAPLAGTYGKQSEERILSQKYRYYELIGKSDSALMFYKKYEKKRLEAIRNKERTKIHALNLRYEREKKDNEITSKDLKLQLLEEEARQQKWFFIFILAGVIVLGLGILVFYLNYRNHLLKKARETAIQAANTKSLFLDTITHELRTPLSTILGSAHLLEGEKNEESRNGLIKAICFSSEYLNKLIENTILLKTLATPKSPKKMGKRPLERFNCRELIEGMRGTLVHSKNSNRLEIRIDKNIPKFVIGPELDLSRILVNLLSNSDKFTQNGLIKIIVQKSVTTLEDRIALTFTVSDNGSGIEDEEKEKVFHAFYSGRAHRNEQYTGMGLGLNLVKGLLEKNGAEPRLESRYGIGTSISFTMEFGVPKEQDTQIPSHISKNEKTKHSILLVEDNEVNQDMIKRIIEGLGYHCDVADNGKIAVKKYKALRYSLVLMDMMMPVMDGFEASLLIKEYDSKAVIVALTAVSKEKYDDIFKELNLEGVISKPANAKKIQEVLEAVLHPISKSIAAP